jgi:hypothetical protein
MDGVPGFEGSLGPLTDAERCAPHVYARDITSGAGNCVCGAALPDDLHVQAAPGVPIPDEMRRVLKSAAEPEQRFIVGLAYQCGADPKIGKGLDGGRDFFSKAELEKAAHTFMISGPVGGLFHADGTEGHVTFVESGIHRGPDWDAGNGLVLKDGDWFLGAICDPIAWDLVKSGRVTGFSPQGYAKRRRPTLAAA